MRTLLRKYKVSRVETFPGKVGRRLHLIVADEFATNSTAEEMPMRLAVPVESADPINMDGTYDAIIVNADAKADTFVSALADVVRNAEHDVEVLHSVILDIVEDGLGLQVSQSCPTTADRLRESRSMLDAYAKRFHELRIENERLRTAGLGDAVREVEREVPFDSDAAARVLARLRAHFPNEKHGRIGDYVTALLDRVEAAALEVGSNEWHRVASWAAYAGASGMLRASQERERIAQHYRELACKEVEEAAKDREMWRAHTASLQKQISILKRNEHAANHVPTVPSYIRKAIEPFGFSADAEGAKNLRRVLARVMRSEWCFAADSACAPVFAYDAPSHARNPSQPLTYCGLTPFEVDPVTPFAPSPGRTRCHKCSIAAEIWDAQLAEIAGKS